VRALREWEALELLPLPRRQRLYVPIEARDRDLAVLVLHGRENLGEHERGIGHGPPERSGVQVGAAPPQVDLIVDQAPQGVAKGGEAPLEHGGIRDQDDVGRSEEHTSELQSRFDLVCRLLLEKKKRKYETI